MKYRLADLLCCPSCQGFPLALEVFSETTAHRCVPDLSHVACEQFCARKSDADPKNRTVAECARCYGTEIMDGKLVCRNCEREFPIIGGIPRFQPDPVADYPEFFKRYSRYFRNAKELLISVEEHLQKTKRSFGYQWLRFQVTPHEENREVFYDRVGLKPGDLVNRLVIEVGCGMGRYLKVVAEERGAEVVGFDLTVAVDRAYRETREYPLVHVVQADLFQLPFRRQCFDLVYSIGVLHHTPSTKQAFASIVPLARPGGRVAIWVYPTWVPPSLKAPKKWFAAMKGALSEGLRKLTVRMPLPLLHRLCYIAVPLGWLQRKINQLPGPLKIVFSPLLLPTVSTHPDWRVRVCDTFDWYSPVFQWKHTSQEVVTWFQDMGLEKITVGAKAVTVRGIVPARLLAGTGEARAQLTELRREV